MNPKGPSGSCVKAAEAGDCLLHLPPFILQEILELPSKIDRRFEFTAERVDRFVAQIREYTVFVTDVPEVFVHPTDAKDSAYVNLALVTNSELVVSRDRHLLGLMDANTPQGRSFHNRFPTLRVLRPVEFLREMDARRASPPEP